MVFPLLIQVCDERLQSGRFSYEVSDGNLERRESEGFAEYKISPEVESHFEIVFHAP